MSVSYKGIGPENLPFPIFDGSVPRGFNGNCYIDCPGDLILNPNGLIVLNSGMCYNYHLITDSDLQKNNLIEKSVISSTSDTISVDATGLDITPGYYDSYLIRIISGTGASNMVYKVTGYVGGIFSISPDWVIPPDTSSIVEIFEGTKFYITKKHYYVEFETQHVDTVYIPNAEDCSGRSLILSYGKDRPTDRWLYVSPSDGTNDSIDTCHLFDQKTLFLDMPNQRFSLTSSGVDNWVIV